MKRTTALIGVVAITAACSSGAVSGSPNTEAGNAASEGERTRTTTGSKSITARRVVGGLDYPAAFTFAPDGRIFYGERFSGEIRIYNRARKRDRFFFRVPSVSTEGEQGLLGIALHPRYPRRPFVYAYATRRTQNGLRNQIVRIRGEGGRGRGMRVIFSSSTVAGAYHDGGRILFGPDRMLYAVVGESHDESEAQNLRTAGGKVLRMTPRGKPAPGNPFPGRRIFAYGIRNSYGFDFDPRTGRMWETDAGPECNDELNRIIKGRNFGWGPNASCSGSPPENTNRDGPRPVMPRRVYNPVITPTGVVFCARCHLGTRNRGKLFFGAYNTGAIRRVKLGKRRLNVVSQTVVYTHNDGVLSMEAGPSRRLFFSDSNSIWRLVLS